MKTTLFFHLLSYWWAPGLFPGLCSCAQCYDQLILHVSWYMCACFLLGSYIRVEVLGYRYIQFWEVRPDPFSKGLYLLVLLQAMDMTSWEPMSSARGIGRCFNFCQSGLKGYLISLVTNDAENLPVHIYWTCLLWDACSYCFSRGPFVLFSLTCRNFLYILDPSHFPVMFTVNTPIL